MNQNNPIQFRTFTSTYNGLSNKLINDVVVKAADGKTCVAKALWDTGASNSCISEELVNQLSLAPISSTRLFTPSGEDTALIYCVDIYLPNNVIIPDVRVIGSKIGKQNLGMLIGMNIICHGDFAISNYNGHTQFTFRVPSMSNADFSSGISGYKGITQVKLPTPGRNDPCPCGSGKKYKHCCGK